MNKETLKPKRTEEVQHIIDRMPTKFSYWVTILVLFIVISILTLGWLIRYHDIASGVITINADNAPVKLVANNAGKLKLLLKTRDRVKENEYVAYIYNSANVEDVEDLNKALSTFDINNGDSIYLKKQFLFNKKYSLGELNTKYYQFLNSLNLLANFQRGGVYLKQEISLNKVLKEYTKMLNSALTKSKYNKKSEDLFKRFYQRDSTLLSTKIISEAEFNKSELNYLDVLSVSESSDFENSQLVQQIESTQNKLEQLLIEKNEKSIQLKLEMVSTFSELKDNIKTWEEKYIFKSPIDGNVQFLRFWVDNHFVQAGEQVFTITPSYNEIYGQVNLPNIGSGKVKVGQEVVIKLDDYPYLEFGIIKGTVKEISLTTHTEKTQEGDVENYLIRVQLPKLLTTNYGKTLENKHEIRGTAEIITNNRRLIQRMFNNLKYLLNN